MADNQLFNEIGDEIKDALKTGLTKGDFSALNDAILGSVNKVIDEATDQLEKSTGYSNGRPINVSSHRYSNYSSGAATRAKQMELEREREERLKRNRERMQRERLRNEEKRSARIKARREEAALRRKMNSPNAIILNGKLLPTKFKAKHDTGSLLAIVFGCVGFIFFGMTAAVFGLIMGEDAAFRSSFAIFTLLTAFSGFIAGLGIYLRDMLDRARKYARICGEKMYSKVSQLASATGRSEKKVRKDIKKMLNMGYYPEGYIDEEETTLMLSEEVYSDYTNMKRQEMADARAAEEERLTREAKSELDQMVEEGMAAIDKLHKLNDDIPGEVISRKLYVLEDLLKQMFTRVREHPEQMDRMHKLMDYYLPTMLKLVEAYAEYDKVSAPGPEILQAKSEIENTLDTINEAFTQLLNNLFQDSVWDVTSDAKVLTTMLTQEGLAQESALKTQ
ncbi:MAG: 5-bromo-4-chloroindolyl phosphate hydrolysis family protein [Lachnospiraceae bacterium]|nr:5-bromo-4-chloroindolyl phosphate hydrolysis family protein [Lachnospiraceae bacterium]